MTVSSHNGHRIPETVNYTKINSPLKIKQTEKENFKSHKQSTKQEKPKENVLQAKTTILNENKINAPILVPQINDTMIFSEKSNLDDYIIGK